MPDLAMDDGARLHVEEHGSGPVVLFLHGALAAGGAFRGQLPALRDRYRVLLVDQRGHGKSSRFREDEGVDLARLVRDAAAVVDAHGGRAHVVGASMGGLVAARLAEAHPERVDALALLSTPAGPDPGWMAFFAGTPPEALPEATQRLARHWHGEPDWRGLARRLFAHFASPPPDAFAQRPRAARALVMQAVDDELLDPGDADAWARRIDGPATVARAEGGHAFFADGRGGTRSANQALARLLDGS